MKPKTLAFLAVGLSTLVLVACGSEQSDEEPGGDGAQTGLSFALQPKGENGPTERQDLSCTSSEPDNEAACDAVAEIPDSAIEPVPKDALCTQQFGGADLLNVTGTLDGADINVDLSRADGCEIDRFEEWLPVIEELYPDYEPGSSIALPKG